MQRVSVQIIYIWIQIRNNAHAMRHVCTRS
jgi:hypothetical protein